LATYRKIFDFETFTDGQRGYAKHGGCTNPPKGERVLFSYTRVLLNSKQSLTKTPFLPKMNF
jgi:hypothetical protein